MKVLRQPFVLVNVNSEGKKTHKDELFSIA